MPTIRAVSLDFHDTIALCPTWFQLEVRHLASAVHARLVDQTLLPPGPDSATLDAAYRALRLEIHEHGQEQDAVTGVATVFQRLGLIASTDHIAAVVEALMRDALADLAPRAGILATVRAFHAAGLPIGITSSAVYHPYLVWATERLGLAPYLTSIITSASCGYYKSRPEIFWRTADALGAPPAEVIHVGDSWRFDVLAAQRAGLRTAWLCLTGQPPPDDSADVVVTELAPLAGSVLTLP